MTIPPDPCAYCLEVQTRLVADHGKLAWMKFYPRDFLADGNVRLMGLSGVGAYVLLLCHYWLEGSLPNDNSVLRRIAFGSKLKTILEARSAFKSCDCGRLLIQKRMESERHAAGLNHDAAAAKGAAGGRKAAENRRARRAAEAESESSPATSPATSSAIAGGYHSQKQKQKQKDAYMHRENSDSGSGRAKRPKKTRKADGVEACGAWSVVVHKADIEPAIAIAVLSRYFETHGAFPTERRVADALQEGKDRGIAGESLQRWLVAAINRGPKP